MPLVRPVTMCPVVFASLPPMAVQSGFHVWPLSPETRYSYVVIVLSLGSSQDKVVSRSSPDVALRFGAAGTANGVAVVSDTLLMVTS